MNYAYHGLPEQMIGTKLIPLSEMHAKNPELRAKYLEKYKGREDILERRIPLLDCLWNDVVQLLPVHPKKIFEQQQQLGLIAEIPPYSYYEIDIAALDPTKTVVYFKDAPGEENVTVQWLSDVDVASLNEIPPATIEYYKSLVGTGEQPFNYQFIPHIVTRDTVDITGTNIIVIDQ